MVSKLRHQLDWHAAEDMVRKIFVDKKKKSVRFHDNGKWRTERENETIQETSEQRQTLSVVTTDLRWGWWGWSCRDCLVWPVMELAVEFARVEVQNELLQLAWNASKRKTKC